MPTSLRPWNSSPVLCQGGSGITTSFILGQPHFQAFKGYSSITSGPAPGVLARMLKINSHKSALQQRGCYPILRSVLSDPASQDQFLRISS